MPTPAPPYAGQEQELETYVLACQALHTSPLPAFLQALTHPHPTHNLVELPNLTEIEVCAVALALSRSRLVHGLHLPGCRPGAEGMKQLGQALAENEVLHTLSFTDSAFVCPEEGDTLVLFLTDLKQNLASSALQHLTLRHCQLTVAQIDALVECLVYLPHFTHGSLDLSQNALPAEAAVLLGKLVRAHNGPGHVNLAHNRLGDEGAAALGGAFAADLSSSSVPEKGGLSSTHRRRSLSGSIVGRDGCLKESFLRPWAFNLTSLNLGHNGIGDAGLAELVKGLRVYMGRNGPCPLKHLYLDGNRITDSGVVDHVHQLFPHEGLALERLGLAHNRLQGEGFHALAEVLSQEGGHVQLAHLDVRGNSVTGEGLQSLSLLLADKTTTLTEFYLTLPPLLLDFLEEDEAQEEKDEQEQLILYAAVFELVNAAATSRSLTNVHLEGSRDYLTQELAQSIMRMEQTLSVNRSSSAFSSSSLVSPLPPPPPRIVERKEEHKRREVKPRIVELVEEKRREDLTIVSNQRMQTPSAQPPLPQAPQPSTSMRTLRRQASTPPPPHLGAVPEDTEKKEEEESKVLLRKTSAAARPARSSSTTITRTTSLHERVHAAKTTTMTRVAPAPKSPRSSSTPTARAEEKKEETATPSCCAASAHQHRHKHPCCATATTTTSSPPRKPGVPKAVSSPPSTSVMRSTVSAELKRWDHRDVPTTTNAGKPPPSSPARTRTTVPATTTSSKPTTISSSVSKDPRVTSSTTTSTTLAERRQQDKTMQALAHQVTTLEKALLEAQGRLAEEEHMHQEIMRLIVELLTARR